MSYFASFLPPAAALPCQLTLNRAIAGERIELNYRAPAARPSGRAMMRRCSGPATNAALFWTPAGSFAPGPAQSMSSPDFLRVRDRHRRRPDPGRRFGIRGTARRARHRRAAQLCRDRRRRPRAFPRQRPGGPSPTCSSRCRTTAAPPLRQGHGQEHSRAADRLLQHRGGGRGRPRRTPPWQGY